ncbi:MAG: low molecular weight protein arginine phosphatase [Chitinivibrionales bacterium]|nr:low molecular weight protein arginine phosphatase [Chitinivibrionales bacterium]
MCRSPMAEAILRERWNQLGRNDLYVSSTGTYARDNQPAAKLAVEVCGEKGIDLSNHRSHSVDPKELTASDLIFTMEKIQKEYFNLFFPSISDKVFMLSAAWDGPENKKKDIPDPMGGSIKKFRKTFDIIDQHIDRIVPYLKERFSENR